MKTWLQDPRVVELGSPNGQGPKITVVAINCPCNCGTAYSLFPIAGVTFPAVGSILTPLAWRLLLNNYTVQGYVYRNIPALNCRWAGFVRNGRIHRFDDATEDDNPITVTPEAVMAWVRAKRAERRAQHQGAVRVR